MQPIHMYLTVYNIYMQYVFQEVYNIGLLYYLSRVLFTVQIQNLSFFPILKSFLSN